MEGAFILSVLQLFAIYLLVLLFSKCCCDDKIDGYDLGSAFRIYRGDEIHTRARACTHTHTHIYIYIYRILMGSLKKRGLVGSEKMILKWAVYNTVTAI
jgi:hypothetical protein